MVESINIKSPIIARFKISENYKTLEIKACEAKLAHIFSYETLFLKFSKNSVNIEKIIIHKVIYAKL